MAHRKFEQYNYKGYVMEPYEDEEYGDEGVENVKIYQYVKTPDGKTISMDWSPYDMPTQEQFALWVELGCPDRFALRDAGGPLDGHDLIELNNRRNGETI